MFIIVLLFIVLWFFGFIGHVGGGFIHLLLLIAAIIAIVRLARGEPL